VFPPSLVIVPREVFETAITLYEPEPFLTVIVMEASFAPAEDGFTKFTSTIGAPVKLIISVVSLVFKTMFIDKTQKQKRRRIVRFLFNIFIIHTVSSPKYRHYHPIKKKSSGFYDILVWVNTLKRTIVTEITHKIIVGKKNFRIL
jgi:hypothetical protein